MKPWDGNDGAVRDERFPSGATPHIRRRSSNLRKMEMNQGVPRVSVALAEESDQSREGILKSKRTLGRAVIAHLHHFAAAAAQWFP